MNQRQKYKKRNFQLYKKSPWKFNGKYKSFTVAYTENTSHSVMKALEDWASFIRATDASILIGTQKSDNDAERYQTEVLSIPVTFDFNFYQGQQP